MVNQHYSPPFGAWFFVQPPFLQIYVGWFELSCCKGDEVVKESKNSVLVWRCVLFLLTCQILYLHFLQCLGRNQGVWFFRASSTSITWQFCEFVTVLGWWVHVTISNWVVVSNMFYFHLYLGKIHILTNIFQRGWNHQPAKVVCELQRLGIKFGHGGLNHLALPLQAYENTKPVDATVALVGKRVVFEVKKTDQKTEENREKWVVPK